jgi:hypothetical protein
MGIYADRGLEYMFQFRMALPQKLLVMVTEKALYQPKYFPDVNRLLVIPMKETGRHLDASKFCKDPGLRFGQEFTSSHCRRVDAIVDIQLRPEEQALIEFIDQPEAGAATVTSSESDSDIMTGPGDDV